MQRADPAPAEAAPASSRRLLLVGNPNVGKSVIFGALTGTYVAVSNYPGTTVEVTRGQALFGGERWEVVDTPGVNNLTPMSEDEVVTRDILLEEPVAAVLQVADAKNLRRALLLSLQLAELEVPFALDLNMVDEARSRGLNFRWRTLGERLGVPVTATVATERRGLRALAGLVRRLAAPERARTPLRPSYPPPIEQAVEEVAALLPEGRLARRGLALMLLAGDETLAAWTRAHLSPAARVAITESSRTLAARLGAPVFTVVNRHRLALADELAAAVLIDGAGEPDAAAAAAAASAAPGRPRAAVAAALAGAATLVAALAVDSALGALAGAGRGGPDPLGGVTALAVLRRACSAGLWRGWHLAPLLLAPALLAAAFVAVRRAARPVAGVVRLAVGFALSYLAFLCAYPLARHLGAPALAVHAFLPLSLVAIGAFALLPAARDAALARRFGELAMHRFVGPPIAAAVLLLVYQVVGVFGAGTAVKLLEDDLFGKPLCAVTIDAASGETRPVHGLPSAATVQAVRRPDAAGARFEVRLTARGSGVPHAAPASFYAQRGARIEAVRRVGPGVYEVAVAGRGALEVRTWTGFLNRGVYRLFSDHVPWAFARDLFAGPYGVLTMALTYAVAIVLPIVFMFFIVFSLMEDSGYLPRLAVVVNRAFRPLGLNGKAVLPMILGLGCDTMATLTTRILETRKERLLVTLLLALGVPCSAQLGVILGMLSGVGFAAALWWAGSVAGTMLLVGFLAARLLPGAPSDFLLEIPPIRRPQLGNLLHKTGARLWWYLREAVPLFVLGTLILFVLDRSALLGWLQRAGEPVVTHWLGLPRATTEAFLIGFLRRDFAATQLYDLARSGALDTVQTVVAMTTVTLFIPCVANVIVIAKERGAAVAVGMLLFIFPVAFAVGGLTARLMRAWPQAGGAAGAATALVVGLGLVIAVLVALARLRTRRPYVEGARW